MDGWKDEWMNGWMDGWMNGEYLYNILSLSLILQIPNIIKELL